MMTKIKLTLAALLLSLAACDVDINIPDISTEGGTGSGEDAEDCEAGSLDCECFDGQFCAAGLGCIDAVCVPCSLGGEGCDCYGDGTCEPGLICEPGSLFCRDAGA